MLWLGYTREPDTGWSKGWGGPRGWHERHMYKTAAARADQIYGRALELYEHSRQEHPDRVVSSLMITSYAVEPVKSDQLYLWQGEEARADRIEEAMNTINDRYGELKLVPASVMKSKNPMVDKIPFGTVRYFD